MDSTDQSAWPQSDQPPVTVIFIGESPLDPWHIERWGIAAMQRAGCEVLYLDDEAVRRGGDAAPSAQHGVLAFGDVGRLSSHVTGRARLVVLSAAHLGAARLKPLAKLLADRRMPWCLVVTAPIPPLAPAASAGARLRFLRFEMRRILRRHGVLAAVRIAAARLLVTARRRLGVAPSRHDPHYALLAGSAAEAAVPGPHVKRIAGHSQDYELARARGLLAPVPAEDVCVFIDQDVSGHPDWASLGIAAAEVPDARWYRAALLRCFAVVEAATGLRVVVLTHPRCRYAPGQFGAHETRSGDTMGSVARARLVLGHDSTALGYAVLFRKPVALLNSRVFVRAMGGRYDRCIRGFRDALGSPVLSMDEPSPEQLGTWQDFDEERYAEYLRRYLRYPGSPEGSPWAAAIAAIAGDRRWNAAACAPVEARRAVRRG